MTDIFTGDQPNKQEAGDQPKPASSGADDKSAQVQQSDNYDDFLSEITDGSGRRKYATVSDALRAAPHQQAHIAKLEEENAELRQAAEKVTELESKVAQLLQGADQQTQQGMSEEEIAAITNRAIEQRESTNRAAQNGRAVVKELAARFGENAKSKFSEKAEELGLSYAEFSNLAAVSPKAVLAHFPEEGGSTSKSLPQGVPPSGKTEETSPNRQELMARFSGKGSNSLYDKWTKAGQNLKQD